MLVRWLFKLNLSSRCDLKDYRRALGMRSPEAKPLNHYGFPELALLNEER